MNTMGFLFRREPSPADEKQKIPANGTVSAKEGQSLSLTAAGCDTVRSRFPGAVSRHRHVRTEGTALESPMTAREGTRSCRVALRQTFLQDGEKETARFLGRGEFSVENGEARLFCRFREGERLPPQVLRFPLGDGRRSHWKAKADGAFSGGGSGKNAKGNAGESSGRISEGKSGKNSGGKSGGGNTLR